MNPCRLHYAPFAATLLALLLATPVVLAFIPVQGDLTASKIQAQGPNTFKAPLVALFQDHVASTDELSNPTFMLTAQAVRVETYSYDAAFHVSNSPVALQSRSSEEKYLEAQVQGTQNRPHYAWDLFSLNPGDARIEIASTCSNLAPSSKSQESRSSYVRQAGATDEDLTASTANALSWTDCSSIASIKVTGDFVLMLWEWDAILHANGEDHPIPSGQGHFAYDPVGSPETTSTVSYDQQRYLYVQNGTLTIPALTGNNYAIYVGPHARFHADSGLLFSTATGRLMDGPQIADLDSNTVLVQGSMDLEASGTDTSQPFHSSLTGTAQGISVDGKPLSWAAAPAAGIPFPFSALAWVLLAGLGVVGLLAHARWRRRPERLFRMVQKGLAKADSGSSDDALAVARKVLRIRSDHPQAIALQALALAMQGRYDESLKSHEAYARIVHGRDSEKEARNAIEASYASYRLGRDDDVMRWLRMAQYANPEVTYVRLLEPGLGPLREKARRLSPWDDAYS